MAGAEATGVVCRDCGTGSDVAAFCSRCGARIALPEPEPVPIPPADPGRQRTPAISRAAGLTLVAVVALAVAGVRSASDGGVTPPPLGEVAWTAELGRQGHLEPRGVPRSDWFSVLGGAIADASGVYLPTAYEPGRSGMHALDARTGAVRWTSRDSTERLVGLDGALARVAGTGSLAPGESAAASVIDPATGEDVRRFALHGGMRGQVGAQATGDTVLFHEFSGWSLPTGGEKVTAFDAHTGAQRYESMFTDELLMAVGDGALVTRRFDPWHAPEFPVLTVREAATGGVRWSERLPLRLLDGVVLAAGSVLVIGDGRLVALDADTGELVWHAFEEQRGDLSRPEAVADVVVLFGADRLRALDAGDGTVRWEVPGNWTRGVPQSTGHGRLHVQDGSSIVALEARTGEELWRRDLDHAFVTRLPVLAGPHESYVWEPDGLTAVDGLTGGTRWRYDLPMPATARPSCLPASGEGAVVASGRDGLVLSDAATGERQWAYLPLAFERRGFGAAAVHGDMVAVLAAGRGKVSTTLHIVDAGWGGLHATLDLRGLPAGPPVVAGGDVLVAGSFREGDVVRVHGATGRSWWVQRVEGRPVASPIVANRSVVVPTTAGVDALALDTGEVLWSHPADGLLETPAAGIGAAVVVAGASWLVGLDAGTGEQRWTADTDGLLAGGPVAVGTHAVFVTVGAEIGAVDAGGREVWRRGLPRAAATGPSVAGNRVVVATLDGAVHAFDGATGADAGSVATGHHLHGQLAAAGDTVFACSSGGTLHAIR